MRVMTMPDKWKSLVRAWDLAFHCVAFAASIHVRQGPALAVAVRAFQHHNGQIRRTNGSSASQSPVHAWAVWRVYKMERFHKGKGPGVSGALLPQAADNFAWWINKVDREGTTSSKRLPRLDNITV